MSLNGKVAIVTGGSRGIGAATSQILASRGASVVVNYVRNKEAAQQVVDQITSAGGTAIAYQADVQDSAQVSQLVAYTLQTYGRIDILVSNAPTRFQPKPIAKLSWEEFNQPIEGELKAAFELTKAVAPIMIEQRSGRLIYTASNLAKRPSFPGASGVGTAKAALIGFVRYVAQEFGAYNITANAVSPSLVETDLSSHTPAQMKQQVAAVTPLGRVAQPEDLARVIAFFASDDSGYMTGTTVPVAGGMVMD